MTGLWLWGLALCVGAGIALLSYQGGVPRGAWYLPLLRAVGGSLLAAACLDAPLAPPSAARPLVALDLSASWYATGDSTAWVIARRRADALRTAGDGTLVLLGDSVRTGVLPALPTEGRSHIRPLVERALATGRPVHLITDGRVDDPEWGARLPRGSMLEVIDPPARGIVRIAAIELPPGVVAEDTIAGTLLLTADGAGAGPMRLELTREGRPLPTIAVEGLGAYETRAIPFAVGIPTGATTVRITGRLRTAAAVVDSLTTTVEVRPTPPAVLISTAPDQDARFFLARLRDVRRGTVRAYWQVAPGLWRVDGSMAAIDEREVRRTGRGAGLLILHGDTSLLGVPRELAAAGLVLLSPPPSGDDYYPVAPARSPLAGVLGGIPWDSLPPLDVAPSRASEGTVAAIETRRSRRFDSRPAVMLDDRGARRVVRIPAAGLWRWKLRGGRSADAYDALVGALVDWVGDAPARGRDPSGAIAAEVAREARWRAERRPRPATVRSGPIGEEGGRGMTRGARGVWWLAALALGVLSWEWIVRRRRGLR